MTQRQKSTAITAVAMARKLEPRNSGLVVVYFAFAAHDAADDVVAFVGAVEDGFGLLHFFCGDDDDQADAHVEGAEHLVLGYVA